MPHEQARQVAKHIHRRVHRVIDEVAFAPKNVGDTVYHRSRQLTDDDVALAVRRFVWESAPADGPDFVLVHGIGVSSRSFGPTAAELAASGAVSLLVLALGLLALRRGNRALGDVL